MVTIKLRPNKQMGYRFLSSPMSRQARLTFPILDMFHRIISIHSTAQESLVTVIYC